MSAGASSGKKASLTISAIFMTIGAPCSPCCVWVAKKSLTNLATATSVRRGSTDGTSRARGAIGLKSCGCSPGEWYGQHVSWNFAGSWRSSCDNRCINCLKVSTGHLAIGNTIDTWFMRVCSTSDCMPMIAGGHISAAANFAQCCFWISLFVYVSCPLRRPSSLNFSWYVKTLGHWILPAKRSLLSMLPAHGQAYHINHTINEFAVLHASASDTTIIINATPCR